MIKKVKYFLESRKRLVGKCLLIITLLALAILLVLPPTFFDEGDSICLSVVLFGKECYACGMTRGVQHLIHFDFTEAWSYNPLSFIVFPLALYMIGFEIRKRLAIKDEDK